MKESRRRTSAEITDIFNSNRDRQLSVSTVKRFLKDQGPTRVVAKKEDGGEGCEQLGKKRVSRCLEKRRWAVEGDLDRVIFTDESQLVTGKDKRVYIWKTAAEQLRPEHVCPRTVETCHEHHDLGSYLFSWSWTGSKKCAE